MKFRVWDKINKKYIETIKNISTSRHALERYALDSNGKLFYVSERNDSGWMEFAELDQNNYVIEYSTEHKDKNENEIYEGNIVTFTMENQSCWMGGTIGVILYQPTYMRYVIKTYRNAIVTVEDNYGAYKNSLLIRGNINQNPELLEQST